MYHLGSPDDIVHKLQISYVAEACVGTMKGAQHTGEVCTVYLKYLNCRLHQQFGTVKVDQVE